MKWFGPSPFSHACLSTPRVPSAPLACCAWCDEPFLEDDVGYLIPHVGHGEVTELGYHVECWQRQVIGSVGHIRRRCSCYGGTEEDPPGMTRREAAHAAVSAFEERRR